MASQKHLSILQAKNLVRGNAKPRYALSQIRGFIRPPDYPEFVRWLHTVRQSRRGTIETPLKSLYPQSFKTIRDALPLREIAPTLEIRWTSALLQAHAARLNSFPALKTAFEAAILQGKYHVALATLDAVDSGFGRTMWSVENRLFVLQHSEGLKRQKRLSSEITQLRPPSDVVAYLTYQISQRNEEQVSTTRWVARLKDQLRAADMDDGLRQYLLYRLIGDPPKTELGVSNILRIEEPTSILDLYETFVMLAQLCCSGFVPSLASTFVGECTTLSRVIDDSRLRSILYAASPDDDDLATLLSRDLDLDEMILASPPHSPPRYETIDARSAFSAGLLLEGSGDDDSETSLSSIWHAIMTYSSHIYAQADNADQALNALMRLRLNLRATALAYWIDLYTWYDVGHDPLPDRQALMMACHGSQYLEPDRLSVTADKEHYARALRARYDGSAAISFAELSAGIHEASMGTLRRSPVALGLQIAALRRADWPAVLAYGADIAEAGTPREVRLSIRAMTHARLELGDLEEAVELAVRFRLHNPNARRMMPLARIANLLTAPGTRERIAGRLSTPIAIDMARASGDDSLDSVREYAYEDFLTSHGLERPSQLEAIASQFAKPQLIYYLRNICVPDVMEGGFAFNSSRAVAQERFTICQLLSRLDPENQELYRAEELKLTRAEIIRSGVRQVEQSKISVDLPALRRWAEAHHRDNFSRYQSLRLLAPPNADRILEQLIREILGGKTTVPILDVPRDEVLMLLASIVAGIINEARSNSEYGLDSFLSVRVRHGTLEGQLRGFLEAQHLLTQRSSDSLQYQANEYWLRKLSQLDASQSARLDERLADFSAAYDAAVETFKQEQIQLRSKEKPNGLFQFNLTLLDVQVLGAGLAPDASFDQFFDACFSLFWKYVESSLKDVREFIDSKLKAEFTTLFNNLESDAHAIADPISIGDFDWAIRNARTSALNELNSVRAWFQLPKPLEEPQMSLGDLIDISLEMVKLPHRDFDPIVVRDFVDVDFLFPLNRFTDIFYVLFENIYRHAGSMKPRIIVGASVKGSVLAVSVESGSDTDRRTPQALERLKMIRSDISEGKYHRSISSEGGTGLKKLRRFLGGSELPANSLRFDFTPDGAFRVDFEYPLVRLVIA